MCPWELVHWCCWALCWDFRILLVWFVKTKSLLNHPEIQQFTFLFRQTYTQIFQSQLLKVNVRENLRMLGFNLCNLKQKKWNLFKRTLDWLNLLITVIGLLPHTSLFYGDDKYPLKVNYTFINIFKCHLWKASITMHRNITPWRGHSFVCKENIGIRPKKRKAWFFALCISPCHVDDLEQVI
jgi:hypothetical protein